MTTADAATPQDLARYAIDLLLAATPATRLTVAGRPVDIVKGTAGDDAAVLAKWGDGKLRLRIGARQGTARRSSTPGDGTSVTLWVGCGNSDTLCSTTLEWFIRDAIRARATRVRVNLQNTVLGSIHDTKDRPDVAAARALGKDLAREAGLTGYPDAELGHFDLEARQWDPEPGIVLSRLLTLAVIKAQFRRGTPVIEGERLVAVPQ